jgi:hypothetical protein
MKSEQRGSRELAQLSREKQKIVVEQKEEEEETEMKTEQKNEKRKKTMSFSSGGRLMFS